MIVQTLLMNITHRIASLEKNRHEQMYVDKLLAKSVSQIFKPVLFENFVTNASCLLPIHYMYILTPYMAEKSMCYVRFVNDISKIVSIILIKNRYAILTLSAIFRFQQFCKKFFNSKNLPP